jgi:hypothetical protein
MVVEIRAHRAGSFRATPVLNSAERKRHFDFPVAILQIAADLQDYARSYYKGNLLRLQVVKKQYDPDNFFQFAQSIPLPAGLNSEQQT